MVANFTNDIKNLFVMNSTQKLKKVVGNLSSTLGTNIGNTRSPVRDAENFYGKRSTEMYQFPTDVDVAGGVGSQGHYIMFNINEQDHAKLRFGAGPNEGSLSAAEKGGGQSNMVKSAKQYAIDKNPIESSELKVNGKVYQQQKIGNISKFIVEGYDVGTFGAAEVKRNKKFDQALLDRERAASGIFMQRAPTTRLSTVITLFMPASVSTTYGATYTDTQIGAGAALAIDVYDSIASGADMGVTGIKNALDRAGVALGETALKMFLGIVGALPEMGGIREAAEARAGVIISDRMELAFKGTPKRVFSYTFKMIPKSNQEAIAIRNIVKAFKFNMLPEFEDGNVTGRKLTVPNTFDISYMFVGKQNEYLHKIGTCVLENMNVQYGGDRYRTFDPDATGSPPPVETSLTLNFKEMEMMTRERVRDGH